MIKGLAKLLPLVVALAMIAAACTSESSGENTDDVPESTDEAVVTDDSVLADFDANGDGSITIGVAASGPANDGAYYQAVVDAATRISVENGFNEPIVVDEIEPADAATALSDLASQVDIMIVGASEIAEPLADLTAEFADVFWYCNCGAGFPDTPGLAQSLDDASEVAYTAGAATGLLLAQGDATEVSFLGCCDLGFEKEFFLAFQLGLTDVDPSFAVTYVATGDFPFDFDNVANATEALNISVAGGAGAVVPYLGGAHRPVVEAANAAGVITMSAGDSKVCGPTEELDYDIAIRFDGGDYVTAIFPQILSGDVKEGEIKRFRVGVDPEPGAEICDPTDEQQAAMDEIYAQIAAGDFNDAFGAIKGEAYSE